MTILPGARNVRFTIQRLNAETGAWADLAEPVLWAAKEALGDERYRLRITPRSIFRSREDLAPAVRLVDREGRALLIEDVQEVDASETALFARRHLVESATGDQGVTRVEGWPAPTL